VAKRGNARKLRLVLLLGGITFALSALALLVFPALFAQLLGLPVSPEMQWALRMIAITLIALTGNMINVSRNGSDSAVRISSLVMMPSAFALGIITLTIPSQPNWFVILYALVGFGFAAGYGAFLFSAREDA
jgi:hypothetical protein